MGVIHQDIVLVKKKNKESKPIRTEVDTGASVVILKKEIIDKHKPRVIGVVDKTHEGKLVGRFNVYDVSMKMNGCLLRNVQVVEGNKNLLGRNVLQMVRVQIDQGRDKMSFSCPPSFVFSDSSEIKNFRKINNGEKRLMEVD